MRLLRSRNGKVALEIGGNILMRFLYITANGPEFGSMRKADFYREYNALLPTTEDKAVLSFVSAAKRGFKHNGAVCKFLWEQIMSKNFTEMSTLELISVYNSIAASVNKPARKAFGSKAEAIAAIERLDSLVKEPTQNQLKEAKIMTQVETLDENGNAVETPVKKARGKGIGARSMELILEGKTNAEVIEIVKSEIEGANPTPATMAWYRNKLRQDGLLAKPVKKEKAAKAAKAEPAVDTEGDDDQDDQDEQAA